MPIANNKVNFQYGTQSDYNNLKRKDQNTFYVTTDTNKVYIGTQCLSLVDVLRQQDIQILTEEEYEDLPNKTAFLYLIKDSEEEIQEE